MDFNDLVKSRKSIRNFKNKEVSAEIINDMLTAAQQSPSGGNCQPWHFFVISDEKTRKEISEKSYTADWILTAPIIIVVCTEAERSEKYGQRGKQLYCIQDTAAAMQSMILCAHSHGVGTCWCGAFDEQAMSSILKLKDGLRPVAFTPVGYPDSDRPKPKRRDIEEIVTFI